MNIESQVASLELCKKLKALGVKQESIFAWLPPMSPDMSGKEIWSLCFVGSGIIWKNSPIQRRVSAFTCSELGEMLQRCNFEITIGIISDGWGLGLPKTQHIITEHSEADARAKMLIYLLENGLVKI